MSDTISLRVALATCAALPGVTDDDRPLQAALESRGMRVDAAPWDSAVDWGRFDVVVPRSTWDYHLRLPEFTDWLSRVESSPARLVNPVSLLRWNLTKRYLADLEGRGVSVVPTAWVDEPDAARGGFSLAGLVQHHGWRGGVVIKPVVSASAHDTWMSAAQGMDDEQRFLASLVKSQAGLMVQPFVPEVSLHGEWSLVYFRGQYSHAVVKRPATGEFRVQRAHGGASRVETPPAALIEDGARAVEAAARATGHAAVDIVYARVDGVARDGRLLLMEFEALEPELFLAGHAPAAGLFAEGIEHAARAARP